MRIKLDLSDFLEDERKLAVLNVNEQESQTVRDVLGKITKMFKLNPWCQDTDVIYSKKLNIGLFEDEFFIHPDETSSVLQGIGLLKLRSLPSSQDTEGKKKKKGKKKLSEVDLTQNDEDDERRKRKRNIASDDFPVQWTEEKKERKRKVEYVTSDSEDSYGMVNTRKRRKLLNESESEMEEAVIQRRSTKEEYISRGSVQSAQTAGNKNKRKNKTGSQTFDVGSEYENTKEIKWKKKTKVIEEFDSDGEDLQELCDKKKGIKSRPLVSQFADRLLDYDLGKVKSKKYEKKQNIIDKQKELSQRYLEEKNSQVKVVSTSTVVDLLSDDSGDNCSDDKKLVEERMSKKHIYEQDDGPHIADSVTDPSACFEAVHAGKRKRPRRHKRKRNLEHHVVEDALDVNVMGDKSKLSNESTYPLPYSKMRSTKQNVGTQRSHIIFDSEEEIIPTLKKSEGISSSDIYRTNVHQPSILEQNKQGNLRHSHRMKEPDIIEVEEEALIPGDSPSRYQRQRKLYKDRLSKTQVGDIDGEIYGGEIYKNSVPVMKKKPPVVVEESSKLSDTMGYSPVEVVSDAFLSQQKTSDCIDDLATLRRICENQTLTVVKADQRRKPSAKSPERETRLSGRTLNLGPPSPSNHIPLDISDDNRQTLHSLMVIEDRKMPLVIPRARRSLKETNDKVIVEGKKGTVSVGNDVEQNTYIQPMVGSTFLETLGPPPPLESLKNARKRSRESIGNTSGGEKTQHGNPVNSDVSYINTGNTSTYNRQNPVVHGRKNDRPRSYQSVGAILANLKYSSGGNTDKKEMCTPDKETVHNTSDAEEKLSQDNIPSNNSEELQKPEDNGVSTEHAEQAEVYESEDDDVVNLDSDEEHIAPSEEQDIDIEEREEIQEAPIMEMMSDAQKQMINTFPEQLRHLVSDGMITAYREGIQGFPHIPQSVRDALAHVQRNSNDSDLNRVKETLEEPKELSSENEVVFESVQNKGCGENSESVLEEMEEKEQGFDSKNRVYCEKEDTVEGRLGIARDIEESGVENVEEEDQVHVEDDEIMPEDLGSVGITSTDNEKGESRQTDEKDVQIEDDSVKGQKENLKTKMKFIELSKEVDDNDFAKFPIMKTIPNVGEFIAMKLPSLKDGYRPVYSGYIRAQILAVNGWKIKFRYIDDVETQIKIDEEDVEEVDLTEEEELLDEIDWRDIGVPRLLYP